jgi:hypothetical protein
MTAQQLVLRALRPAGRRIPSIAVAASLAALPIIAVATAQAKQQCSVAAAHDGYWSWRMIDGRKCWYEGKPMLSKELLEWPARAEAQAAAQPEANEANNVVNAEPPSLRTEKRSDPMDAQAKMRDDSPTFEALWRARIAKP